MIAAVLLLAGLALQPAVPLPVYVQRVHHIRMALDAAEKPNGESNVAGIQRELTSLSRVRLPGGRVITTDLPRLAEQILPGNALSIRRAAAQIDALDGELRASHFHAARGADLHRLDTVLRDPRFHPARPPWAFITDALNALYRRFIAWLDESLTGNAASGGAFAALLVVLVGAVAVLIARGAMNRLVAETTVDESQTSPTTAADADREAAASARAGEYRQALRFLFLATLLALQERGLIELRPGVTNREYLRALHAVGDGGPRGALHALIDLFDASWYGHIAIGAHEYERAQRLAAQALALGERAA